MKNKLGYICGSKSWGGLEMNHVRNAKWMHDRGHEVHYFCLQGSKSHQMAHEQGLNIAFIEKHRKYCDFKQGRALVKLVKQLGITHLISRSTSDLSILAFVKWKLGRQIHTSYFMEMQMGVVKKNFMHTLRYKFIDLWSCPLNYLENQVNTMTNFKNELVIIPSGIELDRFYKGEPQNARNIMDLPQNEVFFGLAGRFDPQKGQLLLLDAVSRCTRKDFSIVLLGEPTLHESGEIYYQQMLDLISKYELDSRVFIRPFMKNIEVFYNAIDWFVMATKAETFGMVTIEALATGKPVLGSNAGGTVEILGDGKFGVLFEPLDPKDLAQKIDLILNNSIQFAPQILRKEAANYDHNKVCALVEQALGLMNI